MTVTNFTAGGGTATQAAADMAAFWTATNDQRVTSHTWTINPEVIIFESDDGEALTAAPVAASTGIGSSSGEQLPHQIQGLLRLSTGVFVDGRRLQGRIFLPGAGELQNGPTGIPAGTYTADYDAAAATLVGSSNSALVVWSRPQPERPDGQGGTLPARLGSFAVVSGASCKPTWSTLRGRGHS